MGLEIAQRPLCAPPRQNERASSERALKWGAGTSPATLASGLSLEKAWIPARDRAGRTTPQVLTWRRFQRGPPADGETARPAPPGAAHRKENPYLSLSAEHISLNFGLKQPAGGRHPYLNEGG